MKKFSIIFILALMCCASAHAKEQFIYKQISRNEGFTSTVNCIYKKTNGDVWLGTPNGLYRYNGYMIRHHDEPVMNGRRVFRIKEDGKGNMWILTDDWLRVQMNGEDGFTRLASAEDDQEMRSFNSICTDEHGVWLGSNGKLFFFSYEDNKLKMFREMTERPTFIFQNIHLLDDETLFCTSHNGIVLIDVRTGKLVDSPFSSYNAVSASLIDTKGNIWLASYNRGIEVYRPDGSLIRRFNVGEGTLSNDLVLCMTERNSRIWAGTDGGGLNILDLETGTTMVISHISGDSSSFPAHSIKSIYADGYGNIWAGSIRDGLISVSSSEMKTYSDSHIGMDTGLSNPTVLFLHQDRDSRYIWIGTDGEGLNRYDPLTREFTHYKSTLKTKVVAIADYSEDELLLSLYSDSFVLFDKESGEIRKFETGDSDLEYRMKYAGRAINLTNEKDGNILFICNKINRLDLSTGACTLIHKGGGDNLFVIGESPEGIWMYDLHHIYLLRTGAAQLETIAGFEESSIRGGDICDKGLIWLATDNGLYRFEPSNGTFRHIRTTLFKGAVSAICDGHSRIWVGTEQNVYAYLTESDSFAMFGESDGASLNEYLSKPRLISREGDVYMGGVQGLLCISRDFTIEATETPVLKLHSLTSNGETVKPDKRGVYEIPRHSKTMTINLSTLERDIFRNKMYRFEFSDGGPRYEKSVPYLNIGQLPKAGRYDITVSCTKRNGNWTEPCRIATVFIPRPWYLSGWFVGSIIAMLILIFVTFMLYASHKKTNRMQLALKEQEQRVYEEKVRMLINISHELRTPLTLIMAPLKRLLGRDDLTEENRSILSRIYRQSRRMRDLLNMVLDLRKMEVEQNTLETQPVDFNRWITESIGDIVEEEMADDIRIVTELDQNISSAYIDVKKCDTVLTNMLINAVKHSRQGDTITVSTRLTDEGMIRVGISDQGPGLKDIDMSKMFTRFYQSNSEQYGSGIGLSYSKILVELHNGRIGAMNNPDRGATFWWEIPVASQTETRTQPKAFLNEILGYVSEEKTEIPSASVAETAQKRLMIVDDNQDLLDFLREALTGEFAEIVTVTSGNKALAALSSGKLPDIIVSDVNMPDGDGYKLCKELKGSDRLNHIPVVLLTAKGEEQSLGDIYRLGADAFMAKPFEVETLLELLRNQLRRKSEIKKKYLDIEGESTAQYGSNEEEFILHLNRIISENIDNPSLDQQLLCRELGVSRASLYNKMKAITGAGAKEYITKIRIEKAKSLIENTALSIVEISEKTGFTSQSYFSTAFKAYTGMTPSQYKKQKASK